MKMIKAILRPESADNITEALAEAGFFSLTKIHVFGRGKQKGIQIGGMNYDKLPKEMLILVAEENDVEKIVSIISETGKTGNIGDGKIFILNVEENITIRTGEKKKF